MVLHHQLGEIDANLRGLIRDGKEGVHGAGTREYQNITPNQLQLNAI